MYNDENDKVDPLETAGRFSDQPENMADTQGTPETPSVEDKYEAFGFTHDQAPTPEEKPSYGEYNYRQDEINQHSYMDTNYQVAAESLYNNSYYTPPRSTAKKSKAKKAKKQGTGGMGKFIAACLACAIIGGVGGGALVTALFPQSEGQQGGGLTVVSPENAMPTPTIVTSGEIMSGSQVYALGCEQTVGISSEIAVTNYLGMESSSAVSGSGFIVTDDGYIVTNYHVIQTAYLGGHEIKVMLYNNEIYPAKVVGFEEESDIAVLKIEATGLPAATLGSSDSIYVGDSAYVIGNPLGELEFSMTTGTISALDREITTIDKLTGMAITNNMFQLDAAINQGNSGGPVFNNRGEVVGVATAKLGATGVEGLGFAIPIDDVKDIIQQLIDKGYVTGKPSFGIRIDTIDEATAEYFNVPAGVEIVFVDEDGPADKAGLQRGDIIVKLNDYEITDSNSLLNAKENFKAGNTVTMTVFRGRDYLEVEVILGEELPPENLAQPD